MTKAITKNSKKGFTLVELVVVIAILAILAAIAIPVVNSIINTASRNGALSDAQTIELAVKECQADIAARNDEVYNGKTVDGVKIEKASSDHDKITIEQVAVVKGVRDAFKTVTYNGAEFAPFWDKDTDKCLYICTKGNGKSGDEAINKDANLAAEDLKVAYTNKTNCVAIMTTTTPAGGGDAVEAPAKEKIESL
jgi:prepilin-type N-terminal cleavage/methylation domain-containing protein